MEITINQNNETYLLDYVAKSANGAVLLQHGGTRILATICSDTSSPFEMSGDNVFTPLTIQYIEKTYANGKFPSGFVKREGKPSEFETLTSRLIDRTLRPLFPKGYVYSTTVAILVLSYDGESDLQTCALNAAANALLISDIPLNYAVNGVRIGRINDEFVINPSMKEQVDSTLDLFVSGFDDALLMIEMKSNRKEARANELKEEDLLLALDIAKNHIQKVSQEYKDKLLSHKKVAQNIELFTPQIDLEIDALLRQEYTNNLEKAIFRLAKSERATELNALASEISAKHELDKDSVSIALNAYKKELVRKNILHNHKRADGRALDEVRPISIDTNILPHAHGSALFTRGQTQALVVATLGSENDAQGYESLGDRAQQKDRFLFHYNFPPFSVGEASMMGSPGRRELGHGNLARRALESSIKNTKFSIRVVSEILESNGSSSMASVCGGSLALACAGIECDSLIAGVAMGLVCDESSSKYSILTDIMGLEDHDGDMDFKVAGSKDGITAMQMDIKLGGISNDILKDALLQAKKGRYHILDIMEQSAKNIQINQDALPQMTTFSVPPSKIGDIIGQGGKVIREIIEKFGVNIDLNRENGEVSISAQKAENLKDAKEYILKIISGGKADISLYQVGDTFKDAMIKKVLDFGAFVELKKDENTIDGMLHISKMSKDRNAKMGEFLHEGDKIDCQIGRIEKGKIDLNLLPKE